MKVSEILDFIRRKYPENLQYNWDNSGLNIGNPDGEVKKIALCLEVSESVVDRAVEMGVDCIISHHPFLFSKINRISTDNIKGRIIWKLIKNSISVYCMHTSYDVAEDGLNDFFMKKIGLKPQEILDEIGSEEGYNNKMPYGLGRVCRLDRKVKAADFIERVKKTLNVDEVRFVGNPESEIGSVAVVTGSGAEYFEDMLSKGIDLLITGDMKYHQAMDALQLGVNVADFGHYGTEKIFSESIKDFVQSIDNEIEVIEIASENPFIIL